MSSDRQEQLRDALAFVVSVVSADGVGVRVLTTYADPAALTVDLAVLAAGRFGSTREAALEGLAAAFARLDAEGRS